MKIFLLDLLKKWTTKIDFNPFLISTEGFETIEEKAIELKKLLIYSDGTGTEYANEILKDMSFLDNNPEWKKHAEEILKEYLKETKINLKEFVPDNSFEAEIMKYYIKKTGIESVYSFEDINILREMIENIIQKEKESVISSKVSRKDILEVYCFNLKNELKEKAKKYKEKNGIE